MDIETIPSAASANRPIHPTYTLDTLASRSQTDVSEGQHSLLSSPAPKGNEEEPSETESELTSAPPPPPGLELFAVEPYIFLKQSINFTLFYEGILNTYELFDDEGSRVFIALELSRTDHSCTRRNWLKSLRGYRFTIPVVNGEGVELFRFMGVTSPKLRLLRKERGRVDVVGPGAGKHYGYVQQEPDEPEGVNKYAVHDGGRGGPVFHIRSTPKAGSIGVDMSEAEFYIEPTATLLNEDDDDEEEAESERNAKSGKISLRWGHLLDSVFPTSTRNFGIQFPVADCPARLKAVLLGAAFLINYQFYERKKFVVGAKSWEIIDE